MHQIGASPEPSEAACNFSYDIKAGSSIFNHSEWTVLVRVLLQDDHLSSSCVAHGNGYRRVRRYSPGNEAWQITDQAFRRILYLDIQCRLDWVRCVMSTIMRDNAQL